MFPFPCFALLPSSHPRLPCMELQYDPVPSANYSIMSSDAPSVRTGCQVGRRLRPCAPPPALQLPGPSPTTRTCMFLYIKNRGILFWPEPAPPAPIGIPRSCRSAVVRSPPAHSRTLTLSMQVSSVPVSHSRYVVTCAHMPRSIRRRGGAFSPYLPIHYVPPIPSDPLHCSLSRVYEDSPLGARVRGVCFRSVAGACPR